MSSATISSGKLTAHAIERFSRLGGALSRQGTIVDVFPEFRIHLEINNDIGLLAGLIDYETHTLHESLLLSQADCIMKSIVKRHPDVSPSRHGSCLPSCLLHHHRRLETFEGATAPSMTARFEHHERANFRNELARSSETTQHPATSAILSYHVTSNGLDILVNLDLTRGQGELWFPDVAPRCGSRCSHGSLPDQRIVVVPYSKVDHHSNP